MRIAINGFGRIGKCILRALYEYKYDDIEIVHINSGFSSTEMDMHLFKYDSIHGRFDQEVKIINENEVKIASKLIKITHEKDIENLNWHDIDMVLECTGEFLSKEKSSIHLQKGAKRVLLSAPSSDKDISIIIYKINDEKIDKNEKILSIGSCTTNCLVPIVKIIHENFSIKSGFMTTVHAYTNDQRILDGSHKNDFRRARAGNLSMIPTSTGAAKAIGLIIPELDGKLDGIAIRVPIANVSMIDLCCNIDKKTSKQEINEVIKFASENNLKDMLGYCSEPLVSSDFLHTKESSIFDSLETKVINENFIRIVSWYDNEWSFAIRMLDITRKFKD